MQTFKELAQTEIILVIAIILPIAVILAIEYFNERS